MIYNAVHMTHDAIDGDNCQSHHDTYDYHESGVIGPCDVLTRDEACKCFREVESWLAPLRGKPLGDHRFKPHLHLPFINEIVRHPTLVNIVQKILSTENVLCWSSDFNLKPPQSLGVYSPHQDATYTGLHPPARCLTAWVALSDPVGLDEGCLEFVLGSHHGGQVPHVEPICRTGSNFENNLLSRGQYIDTPLILQATPIPLRGGQATLHQFHTIHMSGPNSSNHCRIGLAIRYIDASVKQTGAIRESVTLVSGHMEHNGFDSEPILPHCPTEDDLRRGREAHADAMRREVANYFHGAPTAKAYDVK